ncbi:MAG: hypothetical protein RI906_491 [Pseudomonadota bacterium]
MATGLNVVVVEDNDDLRESIVAVISAMGHQALGLACAEALGDEGARAPIDLLVVDLNLPGEDGLALARRLRQTQPALNILMLTARNAPKDKIDGYEAGADIYLTKPISIEELGAVVQAIERRFRLQQSPVTDPTDLSVDGAELKAMGPGGTVKLSAIEVTLLSALARAPSRRLAYWQLLELMTADPGGASQAALAIRMTRLRKKLAGTGLSGRTIQAVRQGGCYQLCVPTRLL